MFKGISSSRRSGLTIERLPVKFDNDDRPVITRPFLVGGKSRLRTIIDRVCQLNEDNVDYILNHVLKHFQHRHENIEDVFEEHYKNAAEIIDFSKSLTRKTRLLIGSYFTMEYSIASAALFNPSIVMHPNQSAVGPGALRFIMSLRATGEGHLSSIVFRTGILGADQSVRCDPPGRFLRQAKLSPDRLYEKPLFRRKLHDMAVEQAAVDGVMERLPQYFTLAQLDQSINEARQADPTIFQLEQTTEGMLWLARENYQLHMPQEADITEVVIFPQSENESRGLEDLRLVRFVDDDGSATFFGTYTAYNGYQILPQLIETKDFRVIGIHTLNGICAQNKGMALFPRRIDGHYVMCSRIDGENLFIMYSDLVHFWETAELLQTPQHPWEFTQIGNCGSPIETPAGWLLLTHGVGPMRSYCIGAMLLDLDNPLKVVGHLKEPLIMPNEQEREGNVPNVVYTCGALVHGKHLYIPYAMSDTATSFACVLLKELLERLVP